MWGCCVFFTLIMHHCIQRGEIFGFWQTHVLDKLYASKFRWLEKPLGGCLYCFAFWISVIGYFAALTMLYRQGYPMLDMSPYRILIKVVYFFVFTGATTYTVLFIKNSLSLLNKKNEES